MLAKGLPGLFSGSDLLDGDGQLLAELEVYTAEENRVANESNRRRVAEAERTRRGRAGSIGGSSKGTTRRRARRR